MSSPSTGDVTPLLTNSADDLRRYSATDEQKTSHAAPSNTQSATETITFTIDAVQLQSDAWQWNSTDGTEHQLTSLTSRTLTCVIQDQTKHILVEDIIGIESHGNRSELIVHAYPRAESGGCCSGSAPTKRSHQATTLTLNRKVDSATGAKLIQQWTQAIQQLLKQHWMEGTRREGELSMLRSRFILILINPASGAGNAEANLNTLTPMLVQSGIQYRVLKTTHANHAFELMRDMNLSSVDTPTDIVCVSGDGLVHEVVNGLMQRPDWSEAVKRLRIGHIGGGSGNGLSSAICSQAGEKIDIVSSMYLILKGYTRPLDVFTVTQKNQPVQYGFLSVCYGVVSDIDLESESMRYLGNARFTVAAISRICCLNRYEATMDYLTDTNNNDDQDGSIATSPCRPKEDSCDTCGIGQQTSAPPPDMDGRIELEQYLTAFKDQPASDDLTSIAIASSSPPIPSSSSSSSSSITASRRSFEWRSLDDAFTLVWCMNVSHAASDMYVAPSAHFSDGLMDLYYIRGISSCSLLSLFFSMEEGKHGDNKDIKSIKVKGLRLRPKASKRSELTVDGERLPYQPLEMRVFRGVINLLAK